MALGTGARHWMAMLGDFNELDRKKMAIFIFIELAVQGTVAKSKPEAAGFAEWGRGLGHCHPHPGDGRKALVMEAGCKGLRSSMAVHRLMKADTTEC